MNESDRLEEQFHRREGTVSKGFTVTSLRFNSRDLLRGGGGVNITNFAPRLSSEKERRKRDTFRLFFVKFLT